MRIKFFIFFVFCFSFGLLAQEKATTIYDIVTTMLIDELDNFTIDEIVEKYNSHEFLKEQNQRVYKNLGSKTLWHQFSMNASSKADEYVYFTINNQYLPYGKLYLKTGNKIDSLYRISNEEFLPHKNIFYRTPVWKIPLDSIEKTEVFVKVKNKNGRTRMAMYLESENEFLKRVETEYLYFGVFIAFLISMTFVLVFFAVLKKEYAVLFYALYIVTALIEFLAGKGLGVQFFWDDSPFLIHNIRSLSQTLGTLCIGLFYLKFYKFNTSQKVAKNIFKWGSILTLPILLIYVYQFFSKGFESFFLYVYIILQLIIFIWIINHVILALKKQLPFYLVIAFILPIIAIIYGQATNPNVYNTTAVSLSGPNLYYVMLFVEILLFTRYIFNSVIETQQQYFQLKKVSDELKYNFQSEALEIQHRERNKLVANVHDTFGGYLEALKLRLLNKNTQPHQIEEILNSFYKEYRYLLNSLYAPKINAQNFIDNLYEFSQKLNDLTYHDIQFNSSINDTKLSQDKSIHLYRIIAELITNAIKHSQATEIVVNLDENGKNTMTLEVSDNGIGFDQSIITNKGFGLSNVKTRVEQMNGFLEVISNSSGSIFQIQIPKNDG